MVSKWIELKDNFDAWHLVNLDNIDFIKPVEECTVVAFSGVERNTRMIFLIDYEELKSVLRNYEESKGEIK